MSNKTILQGHNKAIESLKDIIGIPIKRGIPPEFFGCTKIAFDTYTPTQNIKSQTILQHSLGKKPKRVMILADIGDNETMGGVSLIFTSTLVNGEYPPSGYSSYHSISMQYGEKTNGVSPSKYTTYNNSYNAAISQGTNSNITLYIPNQTVYPIILLGGVTYHIITMA